VRATDEQNRIAAALGLNVSGDSESIAAARILDVVAVAVGHSGPRAATIKQIEFARALGLDAGEDTLRVASARIDDELRRRNVAAIERLKLEPGDRVLKRSMVTINGEQREWTHEYVVSSIRPNTRVFFKGGNGQGAWPTQLEKLDSAAGG